MGVQDQIGKTLSNVVWPQKGLVAGCTISLTEVPSNMNDPILFDLFCSI